MPRRSSEPTPTSVPRTAATDTLPEVTSVVELATILDAREELDTPLEVLAKYAPGATLLGSHARTNRGAVIADLDGSRVPLAYRREILIVAKRYLEAIVGARRAARRRIGSFEVEHAEPRIARLAVALLGLVREESLVRDIVLRKPSMPPLALPRLVPLELALVWSFDYASSETVRLELGGLESGRLAFAGIEDGTIHAVQLLDVLADPKSPLRAELVALLEASPFERLKSLLRHAPEGGARRARTEDDAAILEFRVTVDDKSTTVLAYKRTETERGHTKGSKLSRPQLFAHRAEDRRDRRVIHALRAAELDADSAVPFPYLADVLDELSEHPRVVVRSSLDPLRVEEVDVNLALLEVESTSDDDLSYQLGLRLGELVLPARALIRRALDVQVALHLDTSSSRPELRYARLGPAIAKVLLAAESDDATIPASVWHEIIGILPSRATELGLELPVSLARHAEPASRVPILRIEPRGGDRIVGADVSLLVRAHAALAPLPCGEGARTTVAVDGDRRVVLVRDLEAERAEGAALTRELGLGSFERRARFVVDGEEALLTLFEAARARELAVEWPGRSLSLARPLARLSVSVRPMGHWFALGGDASNGEDSVTLAELLRAVSRGARFVELGAQRFAAIDEALRAELERALAGISTSDGEPVIHLAAGHVLEELKGAELALDPEFVARRARLEAQDGAEAELPSAFTGTLRPYQREGFAWLARMSSLARGVVLADDMGLGKTIQTLAFLLTRSEEGPLLVVCPTSLVDNWRAEAERLTPTLRIVLHRGADRALSELAPGTLTLVSYDVLMRDIEAFEGTRFAALVLDEAQTLKNHDTRRSRAIQRLDASFRIALTGTPIENRLSDLFSIFDLVEPGLLGDWSHFRARYARPIEIEKNGERLALLKRTLRPYLLRRKKADVAKELPPKLEITRFVELGASERALYEDERKDALRRLESKGDARFVALAALMRLRQLACDPALVHEGTSVESSKTRALLELLDEIFAADGRVLVFSQFVSLLRRIEAALGRRGISHLSLDGSTPAKERAVLVDRWQKGEGKVFAISLKAGGTGLNLTGADWVVHLDPWWNPAVEDQATDRAHRIGQTEAVSVVRLVAKDTIEEAVLGLHAEKRALATGVLDGGEAAGALGVDELVALIRG